MSKANYPLKLPCLSRRLTIEFAKRIVETLRLCTENLNPVLSNVRL